METNQFSHLVNKPNVAETIRSDNTINQQSFIRQRGKRSRGEGEEIEKTTEEYTKLETGGKQRREEMRK